MGGVDKADMLHAPYDKNKRSKKWWHRLFFAMLEMAYVNSYVAYKELREKVSSLEYRRCVTEGLFPKSKAQPKRKRRCKSNNNEQVFCTNKRRKGNLSISDDIRVENHGCHWPTFVSNRVQYVKLKKCHPLSAQKCRPVVSNADCCAVRPGFESRRRHGCLKRASAFTTFGYSKQPSSRKSSREVGGRGREVEGL
ncbi:DDE_Tnp_1_7 domain-containing protein [Trichonephila clavipes]|nr:DDE_Tnp_1_7 domain-containing protein [Trichonephila clavipes]